MFGKATLFNEIIQFTVERSGVNPLCSTLLRGTCRTLFSRVEAKAYEIALVNLETYYSFPNITNENNDFSYSPDGGEVWYHILIPEGSYDIIDINNVIQQMIEAKTFPGIDKSIIPQ